MNQLMKKMAFNYKNLLFSLFSVILQSPDTIEKQRDDTSYQTTRTFLWAV